MLESIFNSATKIRKSDDEIVKLHTIILTDSSRLKILQTQVIFFLPIKTNKEYFFRPFWRFVYYIELQTEQRPWDAAALNR